MPAARWASGSVICAGRLRETGEVYDDLPDDVIERGLATLVAEEARPRASRTASAAEKED